jgi:hypothetical protein
MFLMYLQIPYYMGVYYCFYSTSIYLQIQELATYNVCANVVMYCVGKRRVHAFLVCNLQR